MEIVGQLRYAGETMPILEGSYYRNQCYACGEKEYTIKYINDEIAIITCPYCGKYAVEV